MHMIKYYKCIWYKIVCTDTSTHYRSSSNPDTDDTKCSEDVEQQELSSSAGGDANGAATGGDSWAVSYKTTHTLTMWSAIMLLGIYPKELKTYVHTKTCTLMFLAILFIIAKTWKQPRRPSIGGWIKKLWYTGQWNIIQLKRNELSGH